MSFGKGIFIAFVLFATFMATLVTVCVRQNISLVSNNYYQEELAHQTKINSQLNAQRLAHKPSLSFSNGELVVDFAEFQEMQEGQLKLLRPSDPSLDISFTLVDRSSPRQSFKLAKWKAGLYRVSLTWKANDKEYFIEQVMIL